MEVRKTTNPRKALTMDTSLVLCVQHDAETHTSWEVFSRHFYCEFFRRYPEDPVLFTRCERQHWKDDDFAPSEDPDDEVAPGWFVRTSTVWRHYRFYTPTDRIWVYTHARPQLDSTRWRTDPRVHALVKELGDAAAAPHVRLVFTKVPTGVRWTILGLRRETLEVTLEVEPILAELAAVARGETPESPSPILALFQAGTVKTFAELRAYVDAWRKEVPP